MESRIKEMQDLEDKLSARAKEMRNEKEREGEARQKARTQGAHGRKKDICSAQGKKEDKIPQKGEYVDTDAWIEGVLQRSKTKELKAHLKKDHEKRSPKSKKIRARNGCSTRRCSKLKTRSTAPSVRPIKSQRPVQYSSESTENLKVLAPQKLMEEMNEQQGAASRGEERKEREAKLKAMQADAKENAEENKVGSVEEVRKKDFELRTKDERKFCGIDLVVHQEAYLHVSMVEAEQMRFDEDYNCELTKQDIDRIHQLPEQINLAMPFIHTFEELEAHRLINLFERGLDGPIFALRDRLYEEPKDVIDTALGEAALTGGFGNSAMGDLKPKTFMRRRSFTIYL